MRVRLFTALAAASFALNAVFAALFAAASFSGTAFFSFPDPPEGALAAAVITRFPASAEPVFTPSEFALKPGDKVYLQYSVLYGKKQADIVYGALYDPALVKVSRSPSGLEITALAAGESAVQALSDGGIINLAFITAAE